ncbi:MAG: restriction endonuclease [Hyphomicrobiaceae bacterium]|nr:restriction endonuclease [Hyphomicrobiaceae bacterium]
MIELTLHPNVYATGPSKGLVPLLERVWVRDNTPGDGDFFLLSGFANYNGGVRFFEVFKKHIEKGGRVQAFFGGSTRQRLTSKQVVTQLLDIGVDVRIINRKRLMHAKSYGSLNSDGQYVVVTSGNFTGPGMTQNVEMALLLDRDASKTIGFSWEQMTEAMLKQKWDIHAPTLAKPTAPGWQLLYDEEAGDVVLDETDEVTMLLRLGHPDTARIMADPGTAAGKGSQYFWLSKDSYGFFPPLTIRNEKGTKATFSTLIDMNYIDLGRQEEARVTFEAENNLDFRLGTGPLRYTKIAKPGDLAAITRVGEHRYELRIFQDGSSHFAELSSYAINFIGHKGKSYGYLANSEFQEIIGAKVGKILHS